MNLEVLTPNNRSITAHKNANRELASSPSRSTSYSLVVFVCASQRVTQCVVCVAVICDKAKQKRIFFCSDLVLLKMVPRSTPIGYCIIQKVLCDSGFSSQLPVATHKMIRLTSRPRP